MINLLLDLARFAAQALLTGLWQGLALILAVALALGFLPRLNAASRFTVWALTFAAVAVLPLLHLPASAGPAGAIHLATGWAVAIAFVWATAIVARAAQLLYQAIRLHSIWRDAIPVNAPESIKTLLKQVGSGLPHPPQLCTSPDVDAPSVIGFLSPRLLVPEWLLPTLTETELSHIVLHECEHLRRRDDWINLLQKLTIALFPLNPALFFADRRLSLERELACDAGVIAATAAPFDYATCLTHLAEQRIHHRRSLALALSAWNRRDSELARRVHRLLKPTRTMSPPQLRTSLALLSLAFAGGTIELARTPNLISFADPIAAPLAASVPASTSDAAITSLPVIYHQPLSPHINAPRSLSTAATPRVVKTFKTLPARQRFGLYKATAQTAPVQPRMLLTVFQTPTATRPILRPVQALPSDFSPSYAAIPFANGWLIIQL